MNYYHILGISENASQQEIKKKFRKLALEYHPDKTNHANDHHFKLINEAYQVLSDPQKKANYDYRLKYQFVNTSFSSQPTKNYTQAKSKTSFTDQQKQHYQKQRAKAKKAEDKRFIKQLIITVGALVFLFVSIGIYTSNQEKKIAKEKAIKKRFIDSTITETKELITQKSYKKALQQLADVYTKHRYDTKLDNESKRILKDLLNLSRFSMEQNDFTNALAILEAVDKFAPLANEDVYNMSICYRAVKKHEDALNKLAYLIKYDMGDYSYYYDIASIYNMDLKNHETAVQFYEKATADIVDKYERIYGEAYIVTINPKNLPKKHFAVFYDKAMNYYQLKQYDKALGALKWANNLERENDISLYYQGVCLYKLNQKLDACECWKYAYNLGKKEEIKNKINEFCK